MLLASTLELAPPCWRQTLSLFLSIYHRHIITRGRRHQIHGGGSSTASPGSSAAHQRPIERGVDGSAAPVGPAFTARHFASVIAREGRVSPPISAAFPPSCLCFLSSTLPLHTHTARFLLPLCTNTGLFTHPLCWLQCSDPPAIRVPYNVFPPFPSVSAAALLLWFSIHEFPDKQHWRNPISLLSAL